MQSCLLIMRPPKAELAIIPGPPRRLIATPAEFLGVRTSGDRKETLFVAVDEFAFGTLRRSLHCGGYGSYWSNSGYAERVS